MPTAVGLLNSRFELTGGCLLFFRPNAGRQFNRLRNHRGRQEALARVQIALGERRRKFFVDDVSSLLDRVVAGNSNRRPNQQVIFDTQPFV